MCPSNKIRQKTTEYLNTIQTIATTNIEITLTIHFYVSTMACVRVCVRACMPRTACVRACERTTKWPFVITKQECEKCKPQYEKSTSLS